MTMNFKRKRTVLLQNGDTVRNQVKHLLIIIISIILLSSPVIGNSHKGETLYGWGNTLPYVWKSVGSKKLQPKYEGDVENGVPNGLGVLISTNGWEYFEFYNFERPHQSLVGKTPAEIYWGREVSRKAA